MRAGVFFVPGADPSACRWGSGVPGGANPAGRYPRECGGRRLQSMVAMEPWMPAFAGMTVGGGGGCWVRLARMFPAVNVTCAKFHSRHSREGGDPETSERGRDGALDARLRGHDGGEGGAAAVGCWLRGCFQPSDAACANPSNRHPRERGDPETSERGRDGALDARLRGHDGGGWRGGCRSQRFSPSSTRSTDRSCAPGFRAAPRRP